MLCAKIDIFQSVPAVLDRFLQKRSKGLAQRWKIDSVLWTLRSGDTWLYLSEVQLKIDTVIDLAFARDAEHFLGAKIIFERGASLIDATGRTQVNNRFLVDREKSHRRTVLGRHVTDCRAVRNGQ